MFPFPIFLLVPTVFIVATLYILLPTWPWRLEPFIFAAKPGWIVEWDA